MIDSLELDGKVVLVLDKDSIREIVKKKDFTGIFTALKCAGEEVRSFPLTNEIATSGQPPVLDDVNVPTVSLTTVGIEDPRDETVLTSLGNFDVSLDNTIPIGD